MRAVAQDCGEIRVWTARALATVLAEVGSQFERTSGCRLNITSDLPAAFVRRANAGEPFDLLISVSSTVDAWISEGRVIARGPTAIPVIRAQGMTPLPNEK
jgi:hypothetical protein